VIVHTGKNDRYASRTLEKEKNMERIRNHLTTRSETIEKLAGKQKPMRCLDEAGEKNPLRCEVRQHHQTPQRKIVIA